MKIYTKLLIITMIIIMTSTLISNIKINALTSLNLGNSYRNAANVAVLFYRLDDPYLLLIKKSLEDIQKQNEDKVKFTFYDGKDNITVQNESIDNALQNNVNLLIVNLADAKENIITDVINKVKQKEIPLILININPKIISKVSKLYDKVVFLQTDLKDSGIMQGKIIADAWNNKKIIDKNGDNILQYILVRGSIDSNFSTERTDYSLSTIDNSGIKTQQLASTTANWNRELAKSSIESLFLKYDDKTEAIICNNDTMALGVIEGLQKYGYNTNNKSKYIPVFGIDGLPEAKDLIDKGLMTGTVVQDSNFIAESLYKVGMNLIKNVSPVEGTNYTYNNGIIEVQVPYAEYVKNHTSK